MKAADGSCTDQQSSEEDDSLLGYFYRHHYHSLRLPKVVRTYPCQAAEIHDSSSEPALRKCFTSLGMEGRKTDVSWFLAAIGAEKMQR